MDSFYYAEFHLISSIAWMTSLGEGCTLPIFFLFKSAALYLLTYYLVLLLSLVNTPGDAPDVWSWQDHHPPQSAASPAELSAGDCIAPQTTGNRKGGWSELGWRRAKNHLWVSAFLLFFLRENHKSPPFTGSSGSRGNYFHSLYLKSCICVV